MNQADNNAWNNMTALLLTEGLVLPFCIYFWPNTLATQLEKLHTIP